MPTSKPIPTPIPTRVVVPQRLAIAVEHIEATLAQANLASVPQTGAEAAQAIRDARTPQERQARKTLGFALLYGSKP